MKRLLLLTITILLSNLFAQESDNRKPTRETIQSQIDSLKAVRVSFERKMERIDSLLKILEVKKAENEAKQFKMKGIVLTTKKAFRTDLPKLRPSPDIEHHCQPAAEDQRHAAHQGPDPAHPSQRLRAPVPPGHHG